MLIANFEVPISYKTLPKSYYALSIVAGASVSWGSSLVLVA